MDQEARKMPASETLELELRIEGMDCAECTVHVQEALTSVPGVVAVKVNLIASKAVLKVQSDQFDLEAARKAVEAAGYSVEAGDLQRSARGEPFMVRHYGALVALVFAAVVLTALAERLGLMEAAVGAVPWPLWLLLVILVGHRSFLGVIGAALSGKVVSHTLMAAGAVATMVVGQWAAALLIVAFMRLGSYIEGSTTGRARGAVKDLAALMPSAARVVRGGQEAEVPLGEVSPGDVVVVRSGERIPVDGEVVWGHAEVDRSPITGEALPVEAGVGAKVYASSTVQGGVLKIRAERIGSESAYGQVLRLVEEAEANRGSLSTWADRFSGYYLPAVGAMGLLALVLRRDPLAMAAVMAVACSCAFAMAVPLAQMAAIGSAARMGVVIRGGRYLELLAGAHVVLADKTGTLTFGKPTVSEVVSLGPLQAEEVLALVASAEKYSSHPVARAVVEEARRRGLHPEDPQSFSEQTGLGVRAVVRGHEVLVGRADLQASSQTTLPPRAVELIRRWDEEGKSAVLVWLDGQLAGALATEDGLRPEVPEAVKALKGLGLEVRIVTGDRDAAAARVAGSLGVDYSAGVLPQQKVELVKAYQAEGKKVIMVGDGVNDAGALAQADVGIAVASTGVPLASQAAPVLLLSDNWLLVPALIRLARRAQGVVKLNLGFTALYNLVGVGLAFWGLLPPAVAASIQSIPDVAMLANSSRLLRAETDPTDL
jgi:Cd2+/Zn2+-exporting ATPase/Cu+-exporting ATPase